MKVWEFDPTIGSLKDWKNKYGGCIVLLTADGVTRPASVSVSDSETLIGKCFFPDHVVSEDLGEILITPWIPDSQWVFVKGEFPVFLRRIPAKQWHRSFCSNMYVLEVPYLPTHTLKKLPLFGDARFAESAIWNKHEYSINEAIKKLEKSKKIVGVPLSNMFALLRNEAPVYSIYSSFGLVGFINVETKSIVVIQHLMQEIADLLNGDSEWQIHPTCAL